MPPPTTPRRTWPLERRKPRRSLGYAGAALAYELAYEEARRALDGQERALGAFRTRAGIVLSAAAIVSSFLGGQALGTSGFDTLSWVAIGAFAVVGLATVCVLWPDDDWQFGVLGLGAAF